MSDEHAGGEITEEYAESGSAHPETEHKEFEPITSQEQLEKVLGQRVIRERAKYADYDDLKAKAAKLDEAEQANKTELQKALERAEAAEKKAAEVELHGKRSGWASKKGVPIGSVKGTTDEEMEASCDELIAWRDGAAAAKHKQDRKFGPLKSGASPATDGALTGKERAADALRKLRNS